MDIGQALHLIRKSLCCHTTLTIPVSSDCFVLHTDDSGIGVGTILNVIRNDSVLPVSFYSRQFHGPEHNYSATEKEALAICCAVQNFEHFLYGRRFKVLMDHQRLVYLLSSKHLNKRLMGFALRLSNYNIEIVSGDSNGNADAM